MTDWTGGLAGPVEDCCNHVAPGTLVGGVTGCKDGIGWVKGSTTTK